ncbi:MAG TPA: hypothetical protein ENN87_17660 [Phycisphaerales bacterium]|nr:hypothetical protein [Phycisphaerales bacterium]
MGKDAASWAGRVRLAALIGGCVAVVLAAVSCGPKDEPAALVAGAEEPLLLLDDEPVALAMADGTDNSRCFVCHINYAQETLSRRHAKAGIGCETCHGASDAHCSDENNITPPEIMFPREQIVAACLECHEQAAMAQIEAHKAVFHPGGAEAKVCTDCHGKDHRLAHRTRRWDRRTGELIEDDSVRMSLPQSLPEP